jgi:hypothetical protein
LTAVYVQSLFLISARRHLPSRREHFKPHQPDRGNEIRRGELWPAHRPSLFCNPPWAVRSYAWITPGMDSSAAASVPAQLVDQQQLHQVVDK